MKLSKTWSLCATMAAVSVLGTAGSSFAQNPLHGSANLVLTAQSADAAENDTVFFSISLLTLTGLRDAAQGFTSLGNADSTLNAAFGNSWNTLTSANLATALYFGAAGTRSVTAGSGLEPASNDGGSDPRRTIYFTQARVGTSNAGFQDSNPQTFANNGVGDGQFNLVNSNIFLQQNVLETQYVTQGAVAVKGVGNTSVDDFNTIGGNSYTNMTNVQGTLSSTFTFGGAGNNVILVMDLFRMKPRNSPAGEFDPSVPDHQGDFLGNLTLASNGDVGFITAVPEPSTTLLMGLGLAVALFSQRRRRAATFVS